MKQCEQASLRHQKRRWMQPDAARWLRPDAARFLKPGTDPVEVYPALALKYSPTQPRVPAGHSGAGEWTIGAGLSPAMGTTIIDGVDLPHIVVTPQVDPENDFLSGVQLAGDLPEGLGGDLGGPTESPPDIPVKKPRKSSERTAYLRAAANWLARNPGLAADIFVGAMNNVEWLRERQDLIRAARDPAKTYQELQDGVGKKRPGYDDHHVVEKTWAERVGIARSQVDDPSNLVSIPRLKHYQITGWYNTKSDRFGGKSPRDYLSDKGWDERRRVGIEALVKFGGTAPMKSIALTDMTTARLVARFAEIGLAQDAALLCAQYAKFNRLFDQMQQVSAELKRRGGDQRRALLVLYDHPNMQVRLKATIHTLAVAPVEARKQLQAIADSQWFPQAGDAGMTLSGLEEGSFVPT
ncbi:MAG TPA: DUF2019 domain-containing protein [Rhodopseudomonas sp.]|uniref:DUF2019 domain-containing protein n=1 Tax=Rhodopseudomonas sp. TaxID=1078 RepID=UPI002EDA74B4